MSKSNVITIPEGGESDEDISSQFRNKRDSSVLVEAESLPNLISANDILTQVDNSIID